MSEQGWDRHTVHARKLHERYILFIILSVLVGVITVTPTYAAVEVESFPGADVAFANKLVTLVQSAAARSDVKRCQKASP
jgi:hypothetical protein